MHAECGASDNGGAHHSHRITACQLHNNVGSQWNGSCSTPGSTGPCGTSTQNQHWHSPTAGSAYGYCWSARGGFDVTGHGHRTRCGEGPLALRSVRTPQVGTLQFGILKIGLAKVGSGEVCVRQLGLTQIGVLQISAL